MQPTEPGVIAEFIELGKTNSIGSILTGVGLLLIVMQFPILARAIQRIYADIARGIGKGSKVLGDLARARIELWQARRDEARQRADDYSLYLGLHRYNERLATSAKKAVVSSQRPFNLRDSGTWPDSPIRVNSRKNEKFRGVPGDADTMDGGRSNRIDNDSDRLRSGSGELDENQSTKRDIPSDD